MPRVWRVTPYLPAAKIGEPGHPLYVHRPAQGAGRADNPSRYTALYVAEQPQAAVGETFAHFPVWKDAMFEAPFVPGSRRALVGLQVPEDWFTLELNDPKTLIDLGLVPTDVVRRNRDRTQEVALQVFLTQPDTKGLRWWSHWRVEWPIRVYWDPAEEPKHRFAEVTVETVDTLDLKHFSVQIAAQVLRRTIQ